MNILFTLRIQKEQEEKLIAQFPSVTFYFNKTMEDEAASIADVIVTFGSDITSGNLEQTKRLKWLMIFSAGIEELPHEAITSRDIVVTNVGGIHKTPMAESIVGHILSLRRSIIEIHEINETRDWGREVHSRELKDSTAIILGPGHIGGEVGRLLQAFDVYTIGCNRSGRACAHMDEVITFDKLMERLADADYVISLLPSTKETRNLLQREHFEVMKESAIFLNFGRGDLVAEELLIDILDRSVIGHAVLDVFEVEPLPIDNPLWTLPNCTVSPHVSSKSGKYVDRALKIFILNLQKVIDNEQQLINEVDVIRGY